MNSGGSLGARARDEPRGPGDRRRSAGPRAALTAASLQL